MWQSLSDMLDRSSKYGKRIEVLNCQICVSNMCTGKVWSEFKDKNCENGPLYTCEKLMLLSLIICKKKWICFRSYKPD